MNYSNGEIDRILYKTVNKYLTHEYMNMLYDSSFLSTLEDFHIIVIGMSQEIT